MSIKKAASILMIMSLFLTFSNETIVLAANKHQSGKTYKNIIKQNSTKIKPKNHLIIHTAVDRKKIKKKINNKKTSPYLDKILRH